ncbi:hypothetical protein MATL_G00069860 [Megalops atlanticus]|uniref:Uncharacterized protein n=1 Tax=Megalops atlanticus TaxID=7932 RepID=A0A9D3Q9J7_MEGAT|nr:hypothetical protein MATL_G00069860 [Megalops atlanticus]
MKALQKNQGRTDQILGAMADMLTSLALPGQQWISETNEGRLLVVKGEQGVDPGDWGPSGLDLEHESHENSEKSARAGEGKGRFCVFLSLSISSS